MSKWVIIAREILRSKGRIRPISIDGIEYEFLIFGDKASRIGFMVIWNRGSNKAYRLSRIRVPKDVEFHDINSEQELFEIEELEKLEYENPS